MVLILGLGWGATPAPAYAGQTGSKPALASPQFIMEALELISARSLAPKPPAWKARAALRAYVRGLDRYSDYLSPAEYNAFLDQQKKGYAGVGMDLFPGKEGKLICFPLEGGPAHTLGVRPGDLLLAVDGRTVNGQSPYVVSTWITGQAGSKVNLTLKRASQRMLLDITRKALKRQNVYYKSLSDGGALIRISAFKPGVAREVRQALAKSAGASYLVLDLRGNPGGDFLQMLRTADLFLPADAPVLQIKSRKKNTLFKAKQPAAPAPDRMVVWQDEGTASAAEALSMTLTYHQRAVSLGWRSFGKGTMQRVHKLKDGSALILTSGLIQDPAGRAYHGRGLAPGHALPECSTNCTRLFEEKTREIMQKNP